MQNTLLKTFAVAFIAMAISVLGACKKEQTDANAEEMVITLQPGLVHIGTQWVDGRLWVESFDPITNSCLLRQYDEQGRVAPGSVKVRLRACRIMQKPGQAAAGQPAAK